ncbi:ferrous iron transport protein A [Oxalobacteraceae bacterium GrIS 2.11]
MTKSTNNEQTLSLDQLKVGERGFVGKINQIASAISQFDPNLARRLMEIGFIPGEPLEILHKGFFGGEPIAVRIGHSTFALRRFEAALISVIRRPEK